MDWIEINTDLQKAIFVVVVVLPKEFAASPHCKQNDILHKNMTSYLKISNVSKHEIQIKVTHEYAEHYEDLI